jgi:hypothetical protein
LDEVGNIKHHIPKGVGLGNTRYPDFVVLGWRDLRAMSATDHDSDGDPTHGGDHTGHDSKDERNWLD